MDLSEALGILQREEKQNKIRKYKPYQWQKDFHAAGLKNPERMIRAANRTGKTFSASCEVSYHLTGEYPDWWEGKRFESEIKVWAAGVTNEASKEIQQAEMLGGLGDKIGTGSIPKRCIGRITKRQAGVGDVVDTVEVQHVSGGKSLLTFKSYDQGWRKFQGAAPEVIWLDEEPDKFSIYTECMTRILTSRGTLLVTFTPLLGITELVTHFSDAKTHGIHMTTATWDQAPHLDKDERERLLVSYPAYERDSRTKGMPMMGAGRVFTMREEDYKIDPVRIPDHWFRICGIDFGIDHPFGAAWLAHDRDADIVYVYDCYRRSGATPPIHCEAINKKGRWIPVSWPHDGLQKGKADGVQLQQHYRQNKVFLLNKQAHYRPEPGKNPTMGGQPVEPIVMEIIDRINSGRFKVFSTCVEVFEEMRNLHRDDKGKIVAKMDDTFKAMTYAMMMLRYGRQLGSHTQNQPVVRHSILS